MIAERTALAAAIRRLRGSTSLTVACRRAGIPHSRWLLYEAGRRQPRRRTLQRIAAGLGCSLLALEAETLSQAAARARRRPSTCPRPVPRWPLLACLCLLLFLSYCKC